MDEGTDADSSSSPDQLCAENVRHFHAQQQEQEHQQQLSPQLQPEYQHDRQHSPLSSDPVLSTPSQQLHDPYLPYDFATIAGHDDDDDDDGDDNDDRFMTDHDSALGEDEYSERGSLTESVLAYRTINGRRYHAERGSAQHWAANDDAHIESAELHYYVINDYQGGLYKAPVDLSAGGKVLDIGTGNGLWAV